MKTNLIVAFLALSPLFSYIVLSSCTPQQASYGPIKRDASGARQYSNVGAPTTTGDHNKIEQARLMMNSVLTLNTKAVPCTCDMNTTIANNHNYSR